MVEFVNTILSLLIGVVKFKQIMPSGIIEDQTRSGELCTGLNSSYPLKRNARGHRVCSCHALPFALLTATHDMHLREHLCGFARTPYKQRKSVFESHL